MNDKKILLIHPAGVNWTLGEKDISRSANIMPPIGLCSLAAYLEKKDLTAFIHDCYADPGSSRKIFDLIKNEKITYAGFTVTTSGFMDAIHIAGEIKKQFPHVKTVFGGVHISALKEKLLEQFKEIDFGVIGEGEETLLELMNSGDSNPGSIKGLIYREGTEVKNNGRRKNIEDLDSLPFPSYEKLLGYPEKYKLPIFSYPKAPGTVIISSRGCPYQCAYCDRSVFERSFRFHSPGYIVDLMIHLNTKFGIRHVNFYDDLFTFNKKRVIEVCEKILASGLKMTFNCAARSEHLDDEILANLKRAGCWMISLGIESGDMELLNRHRSNSRLETINNAIQSIKRHKMRVKGLFMMGLPFETEASIDKTLDFVLKSDIDDFNLTKFTPFPGSPLYEKIRDYGTFEEDWKLMNCVNFVFIPKGFTKERLEQRFHEFYRKYYERVKVLSKFVKMLFISPDSWLRFFKNLTDFLSVTKTYKK